MEKRLKSGGINKWWREHKERHKETSMTQGDTHEHENKKVFSYQIRKYFHTKQRNKSGLSKH